MQLLAYVITSSILGRFASVLGSNSAELRKNHIEQSHVCDENSEFFKKFLQDEVGKACSKIKKLKNCSGLIQCFSFNISKATRTNDWEYRGQNFREIRFKNSYKRGPFGYEILYEQKIKKNSEYEYYVIYSTATKAMRCTFIGVVKRSQNQEEVCELKSDTPGTNPLAASLG
ncbi:hypothetical protein GcM1_136010 [Golovinomyces cichoracearum]|uniref:Uncharacterized protein n=1 Tax=Golovinomyces cichoracearum TaxID=62708 RepID=A0A420JBV6_9PEZI|nr:hypothetical protein GcM1_136010 [Golovinomyces cichoracearum]